MSATEPLNTGLAGPQSDGVRFGSYFNPVHTFSSAETMRGTFKINYDISCPGATSGRQTPSYAFIMW